MALQDTSGPASSLPAGPRRPDRSRPSPPVVLVVGSASRDLTDEDPRGWRLGGAVTYGALALARLGIPTRALIGADALAATAAELGLLRDDGVEVRIVPLRRGPVFVNDERPEGRRQVAVEVSDPIPVSALPPSWVPLDALLLGPVAAELGPEWSAVAAPDATVVLGWQGLLRTLEAGKAVERRPPSPSALVRRADLIGVSRTDFPPDLPLLRLEGLVNGLATLVVTDAERGGLVAEPARAHGGRRWRPYRAIAADRLADATGAGDVFLAALVATWLTPERFGAQANRGDAAVRIAAAAASLSVEGLGLSGVPALAAVLSRATRAARTGPKGASRA